MKKIYDAVCTVGEYTNSKGEKKPKYITVGAVLESDKGMSLKLESMPVGFNGWINFYQPKPKEEKEQREKQSAKSSFSNMDDDIPFN